MGGHDRRSLLDKELALSRVAGDIELLSEIATLFLEDYPKSLQALHEALERGDAEGLERNAHGLKGSVANFGAQEAVSAARILENLGRTRQLSEAGDALIALDRALAALRPELESLV